MSQSEIPVRRREGGIPWWVLAIIVVIAILALLMLTGVLGGNAGSGAVQGVTSAPSVAASSS